MSYRLIIKPLAEQDLMESFVWYDEKQEGLGEDYLNEVEKSLEFIRTNPYQYQVRYKQIRLAKVKRFPFVYTMLLMMKRFIQAVLSTYRNPRIWNKRN